MTIQEIQKTLNENGLFHNVYEFGIFVVIEIEWGDWKHDHIFTSHIMKELGYTLYSEQETETDGSDCYSSIHYYKLIN